MPNFAAVVSRTRRPSGTTSLPMPSPGMTAIRCMRGSPSSKADYRGRRDLIRSSNRAPARAALTYIRRGARRRGGMMEERRYWIGVVARDHVEAAVANGFVQLNYGKAGPLERMQPGDGVVFYSPRVASPDGAPLQAFTAIGRVGAGPIFIAETSV